jgi:hypothetical protein
VYDVSECESGQQRCGNAVVERGEECEPAALLGLDCAAFGFDEGALACTNACRFDTSGCIALPQETCQECRETVCKHWHDQCAEEPRCADALACIQSCSNVNLSGDLNVICVFDCFEGDYDQPLPGQTPMMPLVQMLWGCIGSVCTDSCVGRVE